MTYTTWLASLNTSDASTWDAMIADDYCTTNTLVKWAEEHNGQRWYAELAGNGTLDVRATEYRRWEELGMEALQMWHEPTYVNQEPDGFDQDRGEWYIADDSHQAIIWGSYGNDNSPGASHYTYATIFRDVSEYQAALAEWESKPEWLESENEYDDADEGEYIDRDECEAEGRHLDSCDDDGYCNHCGEQDSSADGEEEQDDASIPY